MCPPLFRLTWPPCGLARRAVSPPTLVARLAASATAFRLRWSVRVVLELTLAFADGALFEAVRAGFGLTVVVAIGWEGGVVVSKG